MTAEISDRVTSMRSQLAERKAASAQLWEQHNKNADQEIVSSLPGFSLDMAQLKDALPKSSIALHDVVEGHVPDGNLVSKFVAMVGKRQVG